MVCRQWGSAGWLNPIVECNAGNGGDGIEGLEDANRHERCPLLALHAKLIRSSDYKDILSPPEEAIGLDLP